MTRRGYFSTLGALATFLIGVLAGEWMRGDLSPQRKTTGLAIGGACLVAVALALRPWMPLNKWMWTSTFAVYSGGVSLLAFCFFYLVVDVKGWRRWATLPLVLGTNAIFAFVLSSVLTVMIGHGIHVAGSDGARDTLRKWVYSHWFVPWLQPFHASLAYAIAICAAECCDCLPSVSQANLFCGCDWQEALMRRRAGGEPMLHLCKARGRRRHLPLVAEEFSHGPVSELGLRLVTVV